MPLSGYGIFGMLSAFLARLTTKTSRAQNRQAIQILEEARDAVQTLHVGASQIITGSVDGHIRTYDLRKGELRSDFIGRMSTIRTGLEYFSNTGLDTRACDVYRPHTG